MNKFLVVVPYCTQVPYDYLVFLLLRKLLWSLTIEQCFRSSVCGRRPLDFERQVSSKKVRPLCFVMGGLRPFAIVW